MTRFTNEVALRELEPVIQHTLGVVTVSNLDTYLHHLIDLYHRTLALARDLHRLQGLDMGTVLPQLFGFHIDNYRETEIKFLSSRCEQQLRQYYNILCSDMGLILPAEEDIVPLPVDRELVVLSVGAQRTIPSTIAGYLTANRHITYADKLISDTMWLSWLADLREGAERAGELLASDDQAPFLLQLGGIVVKNLAHIHLDYGLETGLRLLPSSDSEKEPDLSFLRVVHAAFTAFELMEKKMNENLWAIKRYGPQRTIGGEGGAHSPNTHWMNSTAQMGITQTRKLKYAYMLRTTEADSNSLGGAIRTNMRKCLKSGTLCAPDWKFFSCSCQIFPWAFEVYLGSNLLCVHIREAVARIFPSASVFCGDNSCRKFWYSPRVQFRGKSYAITVLQDVRSHHFR